MGDFTGIEPIIKWLEETGLLDTLTDVLSDYSVNLLSGILTIILDLLAKSAFLMIGLVASVIIGIMVVLTYLVCYVLRSIGLMKIAKKLGVGHRFLAWIPFGVYYLVGDCTEKSIVREGKKAWKWSLILILTRLATTVGMPIVQAVVSVILAFFPPLSMLLNLILSCAGLIFAGLYCYCLYRIFKQFTGNTASIIFTACALVLGPLEGLFVLIVGCMKLREQEIAPEAVPEAAPEAEQTQPEAALSGD